jgi:hypothetical protein
VIKERGRRRELMEKDVRMLAKGRESKRECRGMRGKENANAEEGEGERECES